MLSVPITIAYGDGIGPEIMEAVLAVLKESEAGLSIETIEVGQKLYEQGRSAGIRNSSWESIKRTGVLLKSPTTTPQGKGHKSLNVELRKKLGLYANVRPCISYYPIVHTKHPNLNIVIIRENEEDTYTGIEHRLTHDTYQCVKIVTKTASERICRFAFDYAVSHNRKKVTCLMKDNIMKMTDGIFHQAFNEVAKNYPSIETNYYIVDIGMAKVATVPEEFDVIVTMNLYGDIVSDIIAQMSGSVGLAGSANIGDNFAMFEAVHGSAPDIAGKNIANPSGLLNAAIQMLIYLKKFDKASLIYNAWLKTLEDGIHTADIYNENTSKKRVGTSDFAEELIKNLGKSPAKVSKWSFITSNSLAENKKSELNIEKEPVEHDKKLVGVDVTVSWNSSSSLNDLTEILIELRENGNLELVLIHYKGMEVWPNFPLTEVKGDQLSCRFYIIDSKKSLHNNCVNQLLLNIDQKGIDVVKMEKLYCYEDKPGFFV